MLSEYCKCRFCKWYADTDCDTICWKWQAYVCDTGKVVQKAKEQGITVEDVLALIEIETKNLM